MTPRRILAIGLFTILSSNTSFPAFPPGFEARIAGAGPEGTYHLGKDIEAAVVVDHRAVLEFLKRKGEPGHGGAYRLKDVLRELARIGAIHDAFEKARRIIVVPYNLPVTTVEVEQTAQYALFADPAVDYGKEQKAGVTRVRVDEGPEKGNDLYAGRLVPRNIVIVTDRAWLRAPGMKRIPAARDAQSANAFWTATLAKDSAAASSVFKEGRFQSLAPETECTVTEATVFEADHYVFRIRVGAGESATQYWVPSKTLSPVPPTATGPIKPFIPKSAPPRTPEG